MDGEPGSRGTRVAGLPAPRFPGWPTGFSASRFPGSPPCPYFRATIRLASSVNDSSTFWPVLALVRCQEAP